MYRLSALAEEDIFQIACYSIQQFGEKQARHYHNEMEKIFALLATSPWMGRRCDWIGEGIHRMEFKRHAIYYLIGSEDIFIARVIHQSMDMDIVDFPEQ